MEELTGRLSHIEQDLTELSALDTRPIEVLVDAIRNPPPAEMVPSERANELADEFRSLQGQVDQLEQDLEAQGRGTASALAALEAARTELAAAERAMAKPNLSPADVAELEAAHEALLEAESRGGEPPAPRWLQAARRGGGPAAGHPRSGRVPHLERLRHGCRVAGHRSHRRGASGAGPHRSGDGRQPLGPGGRRHRERSHPPRPARPARGRLPRGLRPAGWRRRAGRPGERACGRCGCPRPRSARTSWSTPWPTNSSWSAWRWGSRRGWTG